MARAIMDQDISFLETSLEQDWHLNEPLQFCKHCCGLAIQLALVENKQRVVDYLLTKNVDLNVPKSPAMVSAVSSLDTSLMDRIIAAGADVRGRNNVGYDALDQAIAWEHFELVPYLERKGLTFKDPKGQAFRGAVFAGELEFAEYALTKGADPNQAQPLDQGGTGDRPLHFAVLRNDLPMAELLVRYGADPTLTDIHNLRPYLLALSMDHTELADLLRRLEPGSLHDPQAKRKLAKKHRVTADLFAFIEQDDRWLKDSNGQPVLDIWALTNLYEIRWRRRSYLSLSRVVDDEYACGEFVWCKRKRAVCVIDLEHDELFKIGSWASFAADPAKAVERLWAGELDSN